MSRDLDQVGRGRVWLTPSATTATPALTLAALVWAGNFVVGWALRDDANPVTLNVLRWLLCLTLILLLMGRNLVWRWRVVSGAFLRL